MVAEHGRKRESSLGGRDHKCACKHLRDFQYDYNFKPTSHKCVDKPTTAPPTESTDVHLKILTTLQSFFLFEPHHSFS